MYFDDHGGDRNNKKEDIWQWRICQINKEKDKRNEKPSKEKSVNPNENDYGFKLEPSMKLEPSVTSTGEEDVAAESKDVEDHRPKGLSENNGDE